MNILVFTIGMFVGGIIALAMGKVRLSKHITVEGVAVRIAGGVWAMALPLAIVLGLLVRGENLQSDPGMDEDQLLIQSVPWQLAILAGCLMIGIVIAAVGGHQSRGRRWRAGEFDEDEERFPRRRRRPAYEGEDRFPVRRPRTTAMDDPDRERVTARAQELPAPAPATVVATCPGCHQSFSLSAHLAGKKVRCKDCQQTFALEIPVQVGEEPPVTVAEVPVEHRVKADEPHSPRAPLVADLDEGESERGRGRRPPRRAPMPLRPAPVSNAPLIIAVVAGVLIVLGGGVGAFFLLREKETPPDRPTNRPIVQQPIGGINPGGGGQNQPPPREEKLPKGQVVNNVVLGEQPQTVPGFTLTGLSLNAGVLHPCLCWAADGKSFYALNSNGTLRQVSRDGFRETRRLSVGQNCAWLSSSAEGLLVTVQGNEQTQGCWVVDPVSLDARYRLLRPDLSRVVSAPTLSIAIGFRTPAFGNPAMLTVFDLKTRQVSWEYRLPDFAGSVSFSNPAVTPDGKYLLTMDLGDGGRIHRFKIDGPRLTFEESGEPIIQGTEKVGLQVSPDGKYVCVPCHGGNIQGLPNHPRVAGESTYVYAVTDLKKPAFTLTQGNFPLAVGFDPKAGKVYTHNYGTELMVFDLKGVRQKGEYSSVP
jgi:predicted Zn finger-like uncharacterized protein